MSRIKECFTTRFKDGMLLEVDFSQLEVVGAAIISGDPMLIDDIKSGRDMHRVRAAELFSVPQASVTSEQRQLAKRLSFQLQYGAGAKSMAEKNKINKDVAERFIKQYYDRYSVLKDWQEQVACEVEGTRYITSERTPRGFPRGETKWFSRTGRIYTFKEYDAPEYMRERKWGVSKDTSFSPTEMKNYPLQGFATADVMAAFRRIVLLELQGQGLMYDHKILPINTIHDSIMFDCYSEMYANLANTICNESSTATMKYVEATMRIPCHGLTFKTEAKSGKTWAEMKAVA